MMDFAVIFRVVGYIIDHIDQYAPVEEGVEYLGGFLEKVVEFLEERKRWPLRPYREEGELPWSAYVSLGLLLSGHTSESLAAAREFDQGTNSAFYLEDWVKKRATPAYVQRFL